MFLVLDSKRVLWQIPDTNILLNRNSPIFELTDEHKASLNQTQVECLASAIKNGFIWTSQSRPGGDQLDQIQQILNLPANEIQRRYVSKCILSKNIGMLDKLINAEKKRANPRAQLINLFETAAKSIISSNPEEKFYRAIEIIPDVIEETSNPTPIAKTIPSKKRRPKGTGEVDANPPAPQGS